MRIFVSLCLLSTTCTAFLVAPAHVGTRAPAAARSHDTALCALQPGKLWESAKKAVAVGGLIATSCMFLNQDPALAADARIVGQIAGSGLVFKDTLQIESFDDPKVKGVTLYVSNFQRPLTERLTSNFMADPSTASVGCAKTGPVAVADNIAKSKGGEQVFDESKSLFFKSLRVQRIYDEEKNTVVYVSYSTRLDKNDDSNKSRFSSGLCAVNLGDRSDVAPPAPAAAAK